MRKNKRNGESVRKKRFTVIDLLICIIAISSVVYVGLRFFGTDDSEKNQTVSYSVSFLIPEEKKDVFKEGDTVITDDGENVIGRISAIVFAPATKKNFDLTVGVYEDDELSAEIPSIDAYDVSFDLTYDQENSETASSIDDVVEADRSEETDVDKVVYETIVEGYYVMTVTVEGNLELVNGNYYVNDKPLKIADEVEITTKNYAMIGKCTAIIINGDE